MYFYFCLTFRKSVKLVKIKKVEFSALYLKSPKKRLFYDRPFAIIPITCEL